MNGTSNRDDRDRDEVTITSAVNDHGRPLAEPVQHHAAPGDDDWREDEEAETDTPENTGSKVGPGREPDA